MEESSGRRIVITTIGSLGDLYPYLAIALGLRARGHHVILATSRRYRQKIESLGLGFHSVRPECDFLDDLQAARRFTDMRWGLIRLGRELFLPALRESYADTLAAAQGADLIVSQIPLAARLVAEKTGIPWASTIHIPLFFFSGDDPSVFPIAPVLTKKLRMLGPRVWGPALRFAKRRTRFLGAPWYRLRAELGLPPIDDHPLGDSHSPALVLALFSKIIADKQPDWPPQTIVTGFPFHDGDHHELAADLVRFLDEGPPPIVFTLGTAIVADAGDFYEQSAQAAAKLGRRAILIVGPEPRNKPASLPGGVTAIDYAPFSALFPRAAAVVHHGGIGTTGMAMRAGRPTLVMPCAWDQPDNAARAERLGIARVISRRRYTAPRAAAELSRLLGDPNYARNAAAVADRLRHEDGVRTACDALEGLLRPTQ